MYRTWNIANIFNNFKWSIIYKNIESLSCTLETNIVNQLHFNFLKSGKRPDSQMEQFLNFLPSRLNENSFP